MIEKSKSTVIEESKNYQSLVALERLKEMFPDIEEDAIFEAIGERNSINFSLGGKTPKGKTFFGICRKFSQEDIEYEHFGVIISKRVSKIIKEHAKLQGLTKGEFVEVAILSTGTGTPQWKRGVERLQKLSEIRKTKRAVKKGNEKRVKNAEKAKKTRLEKYLRKREKNMRKRMERDERMRSLLEEMTTKEIKGEEFLKIIGHAETTENENQETDFEKMSIEEIESEIGDIE